MKVTYLGHSGFLLEWNTCYWLFDYFEGTIPVLNPQKEIFVFCSHSHPDHFSPSVFELSVKYPAVNYIFSNEVRNVCRKLAKKEGYKLPPIYFLKSRTDTKLVTASGENLKIHTLLSTDYGCAFFIEYAGKTIYHAGDLHWWYWEGEDPDWNKKMTADYKKEIEYLEGKHIDLAFNVLDPRQEKDYALGMNYFLNHTHTRHLFPMHFWNDFQIMDKYVQEYPVADETCFHTLQQNGHEFEIML